jgi:transcriptional regulator with XRE-family HTH domain
VTSGTAAQPPMAWRYCGNQVKLWRMRAGVSREVLGDKAGYEYETVKSMEQGRRRPSLRLLEVADELCGAQGLLLAAHDYLTPERFPTRTHGFMRLETEAIAFHSFEPVLVPGLLQTEEYAYALMSEHCPPLDDETIRERVTARLQRQERLRQKPTVEYGFVIYEAALRTLVGGADAMRRQLKRLLEVGKSRNVSIQVLPFGRGAYVGLNGGLVLLETAEHQRYALVEGQQTSALYSDRETISAIAQSHGMIRMQALDTEESARFIKKVAEEL